MTKTPSLARLCLASLFLTSSFLVSPMTASVAMEPNLPQTQTYAGAYLAARTAERDQDFVSAVELYSQAVELDPESDIALQRLFLAQLIIDDMDGALLNVADVENIENITNIAAFVKATEAVRAKQYKASISLMSKPQTGELDTILAGIITGWSEFGAGDADKALATIDALEGPQWYGHFKALSSAYIAVLAGRNDAAKTFFQKAMDDKEGGAAARDSYVRGLEAYLRFAVSIGDEALTQTVLKTVEEVAPSSPIFMQLVASIEKKEAPKLLIRSVQDGVAELFYALAMAINQPGSEAFVARFLTHAHHLRPDAEIIAFEQAEVFERLNLDPLAADKWATIEENSPIWRLAQTRLAISLDSMDRDDEAKERLQRSIALDPTDIGPYLVLGRMHASNKDYQSAATVYDSALEKDLAGPQLWNLYFQRAIAYERLKEWEKAEPNFREALKLQPDQPQVMNYLGYSLIDMDLDLVEGLALVKKAVELAPDDGAISDSLGWAYYKLGRFEEAVTELERAIEILPGDPVINDHLGDAYWVTGRENEGRYQWSIALDMKPSPEDMVKIQQKLKNGLNLPDNYVAPEPLEPAPVAAENAPEPARDVAPDPLMAKIPEMPKLIEPSKDAAPEPMPANQQSMDEAEPAQMEKTAEKPTEPMDPLKPTLRDGFYTVKPGQSLWTIAFEVFGRGALYPEFIKANPELKDRPQLIMPGQKLLIPSPSN